MFLAMGNSITVFSQSRLSCVATQAQSINERNTHTLLSILHFRPKYSSFSIFLFSKTCPKVKTNKLVISYVSSQSYFYTKQTCSSPLIFTLKSEKQFQSTLQLLCLFSYHFSLFIVSRPILMFITTLRCIHLSFFKIFFITNYSYLIPKSLGLATVSVLMCLFVY